ncbi:MAG TPA: hypothetical protein VFC46_03405 [Humisphaera sp.]|nr:hypothetical protein [Humisphaera sp.]
MTQKLCIVMLTWICFATTAMASAKLDFDIIDQIGWRGDRTDQVPTAVSETYQYDAASDTVTVSATFNRKGFCPLPPMLALAIREGFAVEFDRAPEARGSVGALGPLMGFADSTGYSYRVKGLARYVLPMASAARGDSSTSLSAELQLQVGKIIDAGHLRPWLVLVNVPGSGWNARGDVYWDNPGEVLALLADAMTQLPDAMQAHLRAYLKAEREAYPPEILATRPYTIGTPREVNPYDAKLLTQWQDNLMKWRTKAAPGVWNLYGLCRYYEVMGEKPSPEVMARCTELVQKQLENRDWATLYWRRGHTPGFNAVYAVNQLFAGYIGYIRLARLAGDRDAEAMGWGLFARTAALRFAMGKYTQFLHESRQFDVNYGILPTNGETSPRKFDIHVQTDPAKFEIPKDPAWLVKAHAGSWIGELVSWHFDKPIDDVRQIDRLDETGVDVWEWCGVDAGGSGQKRDVAKEYWYKRLGPYLLPFRDMTPELGRFLADHLKAESAAYCRRVEENQPHWNVAYAEAILSAENGFAAPCDSQGLFLAHAWVLHDPPDALERLIDVPWLVRGDLQYLQKIVATIERSKP